MAELVASRGERLASVQWLHRGALSVTEVGGKGASLSRLLAAGFPVPLGFAITADGYRRFAAASGLDDEVTRVLSTIDPSDRNAVRDASAGLQAKAEEATLPPDLRSEVAEAYDGLAAITGLACAVRSSAVSEDGASSSFAGLYESYLNVQGTTDVIESVERCYRSLWSERAIRYRAARKSDVAGEAMAVVVMGLVPSEASGVAFTAHPVTGERDRVVINSSWGLGEAIVSGRVTPDSFVVEKASLALVEREIFEKEIAIYPHPDGGGTIERVPGPERAAAPSLSDDEARAVARLASQVERSFGSPQDVEWGMVSGQFFLLQSRPITTLG